jgi:prepilin-type N-terminal cleavage/methylation domain-containing protein/prepilin-type processing-associated H-X9-DG protein
MSHLTGTTRRGRTPKAFTLVELLVVIGIIALLISILLPSLNRAREQAKTVQCLSNMRQMGSTLNMFASEHKGYLPKAWFNDRPFSWDFWKPPAGELWNYPNGDTWEWSYILSTYVGKNEGVFRCPSDPEPDAYPNAFGPAFYTVRFPDGHREGYPRSYRLNISNHPDAMGTIKISQLKNATLAIVIAEGTRGYNNAGWNQLATHEANEGLVEPTWAPTKYASSQTNVAYDRHSTRRDSKTAPKFSGMSNYVFADGHAETLDFKSTWDVGIAQRPGGASTPYKGLSMWRQLYLPGGNGVVRADKY